LKAIIRDLLPDFKAAARLGHLESIQVALDGLRAVPEVASNQALDEVLYTQVALQLGRALATPQTSYQVLEALSADPLAGVRAVVGVALAIKALGERTPAAIKQSLWRVAGDKRWEVRRALAEAVAWGSVSDPTAGYAIITSWLGDLSPRRRQTGWLALAALVSHPEAADILGEKILHTVTKTQIDPDPRMIATLEKILSALARRGLEEQVLGLLEGWADGTDPPDVLVVSLLTSDWARAHHQRAAGILEKIAHRLGPSRKISRAMKALGAPDVRDNG